MWNLTNAGELKFSIKQNETIKEACFRCLNTPPKEQGDDFWLVILSIASQLIAKSCDDPAGLMLPGRILRWENPERIPSFSPENPSGTGL